MWRLCKLGYRHEPGLIVASFVLSQLAALPDALLALWFKLLGQGVLQRNQRLVLAAAARGNGATGPTSEGRITILVSHRFSTVRMADHGEGGHAAPRLQPRRRHLQTIGTDSVRRGEAARLEHEVSPTERMRRTPGLRRSSLDPLRSSARRSILRATCPPILTSR